jgi:hypothetical protein
MASMPYLKEKVWPGGHIRGFFLATETLAQAKRLLKSRFRLRP